jgi:hypothetical protein
VEELSLGSGVGPRHGADARRRRGLFLPDVRGTYFAEWRENPQYDATPPAKTDSLVAFINRLHPGTNLVVTHVGIDNEELGALLDMNTDGGLSEMSKNRQGELDALRSRRFGEALKARNVRLITYRQLIEMQGLQSMRRPGG